MTHQGRILCPAVTELVAHIIKLYPILLDDVLKVSDLLSKLLQVIAVTYIILLDSLLTL